MLIVVGLGKLVRSSLVEATPTNSNLLYPTRGLHPFTLTFTVVRNSAKDFFIFSVVPIDTRHRIQALQTEKEHVQLHPLPTPLLLRRDP